MQITFDTTTITDDEVRGIFALLDTVRPSALAVEEPMVNFEMGPFSSDELDEYAAEEIPTAEDPDDPKHLGVHPIVSIDANGLPWDERIHSGTKALNADGTWRTKRGVDKALVAEVEATLREQSVNDMGVTVALQRDIDAIAADHDAQMETVVPPAPPAPPTPVAQEHTDGSVTLPDSPVAPVYAETTTPPPAPSVSPFVALMKRVTTAQGAGKLTQPRVKELLESLDKKSIMDLRTDEDALASFAVLLDGEGV